MCVLRPWNLHCVTSKANCSLSLSAFLSLLLSAIRDRTTIEQHISFSSRLIRLLSELVSFISYTLNVNLWKKRVGNQITEFSWTNQDNLHVQSNYCMSWCHELRLHLKSFEIILSSNDASFHWNCSMEYQTFSSAWSHFWIWLLKI